MTAPTSKQALLACLNQTNGRNVPMEDVVFSLPTAGTLAGYNSKITVTAAPGSGYVGSGDYHYNRLALTWLEVENNILLDSETSYRISDLVAILNGVHRTGLTAEDILNWDEPVPALEAGHPITVTLIAHPDSYAWKDSLTLVLGEGKQPLSAIIAVNTLAGFLLDHLTE